MKTIYIKTSNINKVENDEFLIDHIVLGKAVNTLDENAFKLWIYLCQLSQNIETALSSSDFCNWSGLSKKSYTLAIKELIKHKYLLESSIKKNYFLFKEEVD